MPSAYRLRPDDRQLSLPIAWLSEADLLRELVARGVTEVRQIRFRANRSRLISLSADRTRLNLHQCFRAAGPDVLGAIATFAAARGDTLGYRQAIERLRRWHAGQADNDDRPDAPAPACCGTAAQRLALVHLYRQLNREHFGGSLPELLPIRLSDRMRRLLGHVQCGGSGQGRTVREIALNVDLLLPGNERALHDTLLHELAHAEAWLSHGHRGHGGIWRQIARRVGCEPRACSDMRIRRRRRGTPPTDAVPA